MQLALLALALSVPDARGAERFSRAKGDIQAKLDYCKDCHGRSAQGFHGYFPIPRLAGQQPEYLKNQLVAFIERRRTNNIMFNIAHSLSPGMMDALADDFRALNPPPLGGGARHLVPTGEKIFQTGVPEANVAACAACHGPEAQGSGEIPRLAGQLPDYLFNKNQLEQRARSEPNRAGHIGGYESGCAQSDQTASRSRRRLPRLSEMTRSPQR